jgi:hypothetical protein
MKVMDEPFPFRCYNYCDYRCEKCEHAENCVIYREEAASMENGKEWHEVLEENMRQVHDMLGEYMEEEDIELSEEDKEAIMADEWEKDEEIYAKPVFQKAENYMKKVMEFIKTCHPVAVAYAGLNEARDDLDSYGTLIPVKIQRTLSSLRDFTEEEEEYHLIDAYLTSQVVYKGLYHSLKAVAEFRSALLEEPGELDELEYDLQDIKAEFSREFPFYILMALLQSFT